MTPLRRRMIEDMGGPVATEPKMHFSRARPPLPTKTRRLMPRSPFLIADISKAVCCKQ